jgi:hypothetical protein
MNPLESPLHAGIADIDLPVDEIDFGKGIILRKTYCYVFAPYMAAFSPAKPGHHHPTPWKAVSGGVSYEILAELFIPVELDIKNWFDRVNTIWWFAALIRLKGNPIAIVPVLASHPFSEMATMTGEPKFWPIEFQRRRLLVDKPSRELTIEALEWIQQHWQAGGHLMSQSDSFNTAFQAFDSSTNERSYSVGLVTLWGALERLFSPAHQELTFRVSANIAAFLEPPGDSRLKLFKSVKKLYEARSKAAHGSGDNDHGPFVETYQLLQRVLIRMIETSDVPNRERLETLVFS